jgi:hypothetical protein
MASEYRPRSDFPKRGLPLWSWPDLARVMKRNAFYANCPHDLNSYIIEQLTIVSLITSTLPLDSIIVDELNFNSFIC